MVMKSIVKIVMVIGGKWEYDINGNIIYSENSDGYIEDNR